MPVITEYRHGLTAGTPPRMNDHRRTPRGDVQGWSAQSARSNTRFLYSVDERKLSGCGFALSLTIRDCPPSPDAWQRTRRAFFKRLERAGLIRAHWLTEWQRRGVPHLHSAIWLPPDPQGFQPSPALVMQHWLDVAAPYGCGARGQHVAPISDSVGWFQYLSKHAARGAAHYQRSQDSAPPAWQGKTGRMWGKLGTWPVVGPVRYTVEPAGWFAFRRMVRGWRLADARVSGDLRRVKAARRMLACHDRNASEVRGVSEWIGRDATQAMVRHLAALGHAVRC